MRARLSAIALTCAACVSACATHEELQPTEQEAALAEALQGRDLAPATAAEREAIKTQDLLTQAAFWAEAHELNPGDREAAVELASVLRTLGAAQRSAEVARSALALYPDDADLLGHYGMALVALGRGPAAVEPLSRAVADGETDWRLQNALGVALEQAGRTGPARGRFERARALAPDRDAPVNNLALSYALAGEPERAETLLRSVVETGRAGPQTRQNLALVVALQGRFTEAEEIALIDSTPEMAQANMDYVRSLMTNPRRWDALAEADLGSR